jgi:ubiquinone/menaquinone biosynthesis C-methylase UbiE
MPIDLMKYFRYQGNSASYLIPRTPAPPQGFCSQGLPIPPSSFFINYKTSDEYLKWGQKDTGTMLEVLDKAGRALQAGHRVLDFGCSGGRMIRWLKEYSAGCEIWGTDISAAHILWCKQYLRPHFHFLVSTTLPHLPFEDRYFDLIYCGSVFTHIEDLADAWLLELRRILKPGGLLYVTIHDENTVRLLAQERHHALAKKMTANEKYNEYVQSDYGVFTVYRGPDSQVFYHRDYFCRMVSPAFRVLSVAPEAYGYQTAMLLEKTAMR